MSRALFVQNEKVDTIRRIPPILSNLFSISAYSQLNTNDHFLRDYYTYLLWYHHWVTLLYLFAVRPTPRLRGTPTQWEATLHPPFSLWRPGGLADLACIGTPGARSRPGWSPILF